ncbi:hypothetical protein [Streptomyces sp. NPDC017524]|uniref:hypothetical protein n=1 Tax=Streptomyces sp. NPDC017524 TaxID=3364999 RepID=UPI0037A83482
MTSSISNTIGERIGRQIGEQIAGRITSQIRTSMTQGITQGGAAARGAATRQGGEAGGAFGRVFRGRVEAALRSLPDIQVGADTSEADADIRALRVQLETLASQRVGIDVDAATARAQIDQLEAELRRLGASHPNVDVRINTGAAIAELEALRAEIRRLDGQDVDIRVNTHTAMANMNLLVTAGLALGPAILPVLPVIAAGLGAVAAAGAAAAVGVGAVALVAIPAFKGIASTLQAQKAAQEAATAATGNGAAALAQSRQRAVQMASASQALAAAERNGARQIATAQQAVVKARQNVADVTAQAAQRTQQAARQVQDAERSLADAQKDAKRAQEDLTAARKSAADQLRDMNERLEGSVLDERAAVLRVQEAQEELTRVRAAGSKATQLDIDRARLAYDQAVAGLKDQQRENKRLAADVKAANRAGVEGSDTVRAAQERLVDAQQEVADKSTAVKDAQTAAARQQTQNARDIAEAQARVGEATANVANAQQSAADSIASAHRQIQQAQQQTATGVDTAATAQRAYQAELAKLTPAARGTMNAFVGLKTAFSDWSTSLQPQVMPLFTRALDGIRKALPSLTPFVLAATDAMGKLMDRVSAGFKSPWWDEFKTDLQGAVGPAIEGMGIAFGRVFKGMAGVIQAFLPHMDDISESMQRITGRFADWGTNLKGSPAFEKFLSYSSTMGPLVADTLGKIGSGIFSVLKALEPLSTPILKTLGAVVDGIGLIGDKAPWFVLGLYGAILAVKLFTLAWAAFNFVMKQNIFVRVALLVVALVAAVIYAYNNFETFRNVVNAVWNGIKTVVMWVWENALKPTFENIWTALKTIGKWATWLWENVLGPVFRFIWTAAKVLFTIVVITVFLPIIAIFKQLAKVGMWLWKSVIGPVFGWIGGKAKWLWANALKPQFDAIKKGIGLVGDGAKWLWEKGIRPAFNWIGDKGKWLWDKALKPQFELMKKGIKLVGEAFGAAKDFIGKQWSKVADIAKKPVRFVIDKVYNAGIVPTWNKVASAFGAPEIKKMNTEGWARGGILPGQSTFRQGDDQLVPMRRGEGVYVSEAMRDPYERARLHAVNAAAMHGKPLSPFQGFAKGGIFDWVGKAAGKTVDLAKTGVSWLKDGIKASAQAGLNKVVKPLLAKIAGSKSLYRDMISGVPKKMISSILDFGGKADGKMESAGIGGGGFKAGLKWARTQNGLPYQWGGNGNPSWDCSGLVSAIESVIRGQKPHRRWATGSFSGKTAPSGWQLGGKSPYMIGITNAGVGHTAGTINGVNVESRGGDGVVIGSRARSYKDNLFTHQYAYKGTYDQGGYLQPGLNLAYNGTGRPEPVFTTQQANALSSGANTTVSLDGQRLALVLDDGRSFNGHIETLADGRIGASMTQLTQVLNAGGGL